jgi:hypothetical protein
MVPPIDLLMSGILRSPGMRTLNGVRRCPSPRDDPTQIHLGAKSSQIELAGSVLGPLDLQTGAAQRRPRKELGQIAGAIGFSLLFVSRHDHNGRPAVARDHLRTHGERAVDYLAEFRLCGSYAPGFHSHRLYEIKR